MSTLHSLPTDGLLPGDPDKIRFADAVIGTLDLPSRGIAVNDPATGERIACVPDMSAAEALESVAAASEAGKEWARTTTRHRAGLLRDWYDLLVENTEEIAHLITREMGKTLAEARGEVRYGTDFVRWYAEEAVRPGGDFRDVPDGGSTLLITRSPVGLSTLITPWNFPFAMATRKIAPALAAGCPVVIKPATLTPLTTRLAVLLARRAGIPAGLIQIVTTSDASAFSSAVLSDSRVRKVSFTGSTSVGRQLLRIASERVLRSSMELGGNGPLLVFDDADLERAVEGAFAAKLRNGGQSCIAANRIYVQDGIADAFVEAFAERLASAPVGSGFGEGTVVGPMIDDRAVERMRALTAEAVSQGAELKAGGADYDGPVHFFAPTVLDHADRSAGIADVEIFGPIAPIQRFAHEEEGVARANETDLGLAGYVFTENLDRALNVAEALETGLVGINQGVPSNASAPFGGVKQSGLGREGGSEGLEEYQNIRFFNLARRATA